LERAFGSSKNAIISDDVDMREFSQDDPFL